MKLLTTLVLVFSFTICFAQNEQSLQSKETESKTNYEKVHEIRLGGFKLLFAGYLDMGYEYINTPTSGLGASLFINFDDSIENETFGVSPYYRFYFGKNQEFKGERFFIELFSFFYAGEEDDSVVFQGDVIRTADGESFFDVAPGFAVGSKWINSSGFVFEIKLGIGRNLLGNSPNEFVGAGDFYIGYRF